MSTTSPIGVIDSGIGGLTIAREIQRMNPSEQILYFADTANAPYGTKPQEEIYDAVFRIMEWMVEQDTKLVVLACNSATIAVLNPLRDAYPSVQIVGVVPMVKPAAELSQSRKIAVFATEATLQSEYYATLKAEFATEVDVLDFPASGWVSMIEGNQLELRLIRQDVEEALREGADMLVLGCTHFPLIRNEIAEIAAGRGVVMDSGQAVARQVGRILDENGLRTMSPSQPNRYVTSGDAERLSQIVARWFPDVRFYAAGIKNAPAARVEVK